MKKFILMGLPGTGKTTTLLACVEFLKTQGINANLILSDSLINQRIKADDAIIVSVEEEIVKEIFLRIEEIT